MGRLQGLIESWGRGTLKILNESKRANIPTPIFKYDDSGFYVIFNFEKISINLRILDLIKNNANITISQMAENLNVTDRTIKRVLKDLQDNKQIERIGNNRKGKWKIV